MQGEVRHEKEIFCMFVATGIRENSFYHQLKIEETTMLKLKKLIAASALSIAAILPAQAELVLDTFTYVTLPFPTPYDLSLSANGAGTFDDTTGDTIITASGATAFFKLSNVTDVIPSPDLAATAAFLDGGLSYSEDSGVDGNLEITYTGPTLDFTSFGSSFYFDVDQADDGIVIMLTVTDLGGFTSSAPIQVLTPVQFGTPERLTLAFTSFVGSADFTQITKVNAFITTPGGESQFTIDEVGIVPAPGSIALLGLGLLGLGLRSRKNAA
jgi:hypothetical protein